MNKELARIDKEWLLSFTGDQPLPTRVDTGTVIGLYFEEVPRAPEAWMSYAVKTDDKTVAILHQNKDGTWAVEMNGLLTAGFDLDVEAIEYAANTYYNNNT